MSATLLSRWRTRAPIVLTLVVLLFSLVFALFFGGAI